jgi:hypothetical protein
MNTSRNIDAAITEYRVHFDAIYVAGIPNLLNDDGAFLSFLAVLTATEALAGLYAPSVSTGERFREFVSRYYPSPLKEDSQRLWQFRNAMVHSFNPGPYALTHHASRVHCKAPHGVTTLNAEDFYAALLVASQAYFAELVSSEELQGHFSKRIVDADGGAPQIFVVEQVRVDQVPPPNNRVERTRDP